MTAPPWLAALEGRAGPLRASAERFLARAMGDDAARLSPGGPALARLTALVEERAFEPADPRADPAVELDDDAFLEGAGALLAVVLLAHVGEGAHEERGGAHRIRLGKHGHFDPFGAIEAALDADDPRASLAASVRRAEAEARGDGPNARVHAYLERALETRGGALAVREAFGGYARLTDGTELALARVIDATADQDARAAERAVDKILALLDGSPRMSLDDVEDRLVPRLVGPKFVDELGARASGASSLSLSPFAAPLAIALLVAYDDRARFVREDELSSWGVSTAEALRLALQNLARRSARARFVRVDTSAGPFVVARSGDGLDAARLLLPTLRDVLGPELGVPFLVAVPHRDTLVAGPADLGAALADRAREEAARAPHAIADSLFQVAVDGCVSSFSRGPGQV